MKRYAAAFTIVVCAILSILGYVQNARSMNTASMNTAPANAAAPIDTEPREDSELRAIATHPESYRFIDQATDHVDDRQMVKIHSTAPLASNHKYVELRPGSIRYFRSDGAVSADGKCAAITWSINGTTKNTNVGRPGDVIMAIRSLDGVITWYSLQIDMRC